MGVVEVGFESVVVLLLLEMEKRFVGRDGVREEILSVIEPTRLFRRTSGRGIGGLMQGERRYSSQFLTSKKSTSYDSPVCGLRKHLPSSGSKA